MPWIIALALSAAAPAPQAKVEVDGRGVVTLVRVGDCTFLSDLAVSLTKPKWQGAFGDQHAIAENTVQSTTDARLRRAFASTIGSADHRAKLRERVLPTDRGARIEYELEVETPIEVENVLLLGRLPIELHAGKTRYIAIGEDPDSGTFPKELNAERYAFMPGRVCDELALIAAGGPALRIRPEGVTLTLQDDRKWNVQGFALHAITAASRKLAPGDTVRFALELSAATAEEVQTLIARGSASAVSAVPLTSAQALRAGDVAVDRKSVPVFERVELTPDIAATFDNPFDPDDIAVDAEIRTPSGGKLNVPAFYFVPCECVGTENRERIQVTGPPSWKVRFAPTEPGAYTAVVHVRDRSGTKECPPATFEATASPREGFVRVAADSPHYFQFDNGRSYYPVGENVCWARASNAVKSYTDWFAALSAAGGNWARLWLANNEKGLEWMPAPTPKGGSGTYLGLGRYSIDNSYRLDEVVRIAEQTGIRLMFCIGTFGEIKADKDYFNANDWVSNPYNAANGGPCATPGDFFTNPQARKLYQRRLRYLIARWGYSPNVFAWEFWNEFEAPADWVQEMAAYFKQHDVNQHLVSNTYGNESVWKLRDVDFTMTHHYGDSGNTADFADQFVTTARGQRVFGKPFFVAEFGIDWRTSDSDYDPKGQGQNLHNGIWAGMLAGSAGTPMLWYWDNYVHPKNVYFVFTPVAKFASAIDWAHTRLAPIDGIELKSSSTAPEQFADVDIPTRTDWGRTRESSFTVMHNGTIEPEPACGTLGSPKRGNGNELLSEITFNLDMPEEGRFAVQLGTVSSQARLQIDLDGKQLVNEALRAGPPGEGPWKSSRLLAQWNCWQSEYDRDVTITVPAGKHRIQVRNAEGDWISFRGYRISNYRSSRYPDVRALGLRDKDLVVLWLQHRKSTWKAVRDGAAAPKIEGTQVLLPNMTGDRYAVEWWDTYKGEVTRREQASARDGVLTLDIPTVERDVAAIVRLESPKP